MITRFTFSPSISRKCISFLKGELRKLRTLVPPESSCNAGIEYIHPDSFRAWIDFKSQQKVFEATTLSGAEIDAVKGSLESIEAQVADWQVTQTVEKKQEAEC